MCPVLDFTIGLFGGQTIKEAVLVDAETGEQADINALHDYMQEIAIGTGLYSGAQINVFQDGIVKVVWNNYMQPMMNAWTYAADFTSNVITD